MNITNYLKDILTGFSEIESVNIDYAENVTIDDSSADNFGLYSNGESLIKESITGKKEYRDNSVLYMNKISDSDENRLNNLKTLNAISEKLRAIRNYALTENGEEIGIIDSISCSNGMLFSVPGSVYEGYIYQLQIQVYYTVYPHYNSDPAPEPDPDPDPDPEPPDPPEEFHQLTVLINTGTSFELDGWCELTYTNSYGMSVKTETFNGGVNESVFPAGAVNVAIRVSPATEDLIIRRENKPGDTTVTCSGGEINAFYALYTEDIIISGYDVIINNPELEGKVSVTYLQPDAPEIAEEMVPGVRAHIVVETDVPITVKSSKVSRKEPSGGLVSWLTALPVNART